MTETIYQAQNANFNSINGSDYNLYQCAACGVYYTGSHSCMTVTPSPSPFPQWPNGSTPWVPLPGPPIAVPSDGCIPKDIFEIFQMPKPPECALCDAILEPGEKKLCKDCKGVLDAWRFLTKKESKDLV